MEQTETKKQLIKFIFAGFCAVGTDCLCYYLLSQFVDLSIAKGISFMLGTIVAYLINKYYTFEVNKKSSVEVIKFIVLYLTSLWANILVNKISLLILPNCVSSFQIIKLFSFLFATGTSTIINFIGQKYWVFKK